MRYEDAQEYTESLGQILGGSWRQIEWAQRNGIPRALGLSTEEWVKQRLGGYVKMSKAERRDIVTELKEEGHSNREIAQVLGVDEKTVRNAEGAENSAPPSKNNNDLNGEPGQGAENSAPKVRGTQGTGENEWYTPERHIEAARAVLGEIDLDPASSEIAQRRVKAKRFFTERDNGLEQEWKGRIWLNPPYAQPHIANFADKMVAEVACKNVTSAIMLTHNYTDTSWFQKLAQQSSAICFTSGRIRFISPDDELASPTQGQAFFYFGANPGAFFEVFRPVGIIARVAK